ncbi:phosphonate C-P lyase system protein PhnH [Herbivorax sp. ANBcel31]|uniref:phosphonate C-P lyase system protein PhnH n=1 Tax=Herbivorax sp. ANBcel31 TaxID=3069754 RepID=UPI0027B4E1E4|nr:phosphonate C-P lyase system protein PhnH [Herbivorax sp. ANBcel31]MDQ2086751.1 phosphonate C-P lyase system protein PhnH [Herbivorax sp. ANBcel31]
MIDMVHDIQASYRKVVESMSRPGVVTNIFNEAKNLDFSVDLYKPTLVLILMLFDTEITFKLYSDDENDSIKIINQLTYANSVHESEADYIIIAERNNEINFSKALKKAKLGDSINPQSSATLIVEVKNIDCTKKLELKGPGILNSNFVNVECDDGWVDVRDMKNAEYPTGVDIIFVDKKGNLVCIPRTTQIQKEVD